MPLRAECFRELNSRKHVVRSAVIDIVACYRRDARMFSRIKFEKTWSTKCGNRRQAFSVVGVKNMACPAIPKRRRKSSVSATFCLSPLPEIGEGFGEWSEAPSYEEGVGGDGEQQGFALQNAPFFVSFLSVMKEMKNPVQGGTLQNEISPLRSR